VQRIFNRDQIQHNSLTPDNGVNILVYGLLFVSSYSLVTTF